MTAPDSGSAQGNRMLSYGVAESFGVGPEWMHLIHEEERRASFEAQFSSD